MKITVRLAADHLTLPIAYRDLLQGLIYKALSVNPEYSDFAHNEGFSADGRRYKLFTYNGLTGEYTVSGKTITFNNGGILELRSPDEMFIRTAFSAFKTGSTVNLAGQNAVVADCSLRDAPVMESPVKIRTLSPITVHTTGAGRETIYFSPAQSEFYQRVAENAERKWQSFMSGEPFRFLLRPAEGARYRKLVTTFKGIYVTAWSGTFLLYGSGPALRFLYDTGLGDRNSQGFGMFEPL